MRPPRWWRHMRPDERTALWIVLLIILGFVAVPALFYILITYVPHSRGP